MSLILRLIFISIDKFQNLSMLLDLKNVTHTFMFDDIKVDKSGMSILHEIHFR